MDGLDQNAFQRLEQILESVWEAAPGEREEVLERLCDGDESLLREARRLLELDGEDSFLERPALQPEDDSNVPTLDAGHKPGSGAAEAGTRIGSYEILRPLGQGGMGSVYLARRHDGVHHQEVALKILATSMASAGLLERFAAEREILAHLSHPNIAALLDGGTTEDGRPYLVMERVDGLSIDRYCQEHGLSLRQRLELFRKVCAAVQEAHRSLIVHRDLKPANILVDQRGEPKLLDFGIAKLLSPETLERTMVVTATGSQPMTPAYASPEQVSGGAITTAVDVYALGILLHELLTGIRPYDVTGVHLVEAIHRICVVVPPKPSTRIRSLTDSGQAAPARSTVDLKGLEKELRGDLDAIVGMALRKEPDRRYGSAESLKDDIERYLDGRPVKAVDDSWSYRTAKFIRRNWVPVAATMATVLLIIGFSIIVLLQGQQVEEERIRAEVTSDFLLDLFVGVDPWSVGERDPSAAEMLDRGRRALASRTLADGDRADLLQTIGTAYAGIGRFDEAEGLLREALEKRRALLGETHLETAETMVKLAEVVRWQGQITQGLDLAESALEIYRELGAADSRPAVVAKIQHANYLDLLGQYAAAEATFLEAVSTSRERDYPELEAVALHWLGMAKRRLNLYDEALEVLQEGLEACRSTYGLDHPRTAQVQVEIGTVQMSLGRFELADRALRQAHSTLSDLLGDDHPETLKTLTRQGELALALSDHERAGLLLRQAEGPLRERIGRHPFLADLLRHKSTLLLERSRSVEAEQAITEALEIYRSLAGERHVDTADALHKLAWVVSTDLNRREEARHLIADALATFEDLTGRDSPRTVEVLADVGWIEYLVRNNEAAREYFIEAIEGLERFHGQRHIKLAKAHNNLAFVLYALGELGEAESERRKAVAVGREAVGERAPIFGLFHINLARLLVEVGKLEEAEQTLAEAKEIFDRAGFDARHAWRLAGDRIRSRLGLRLGKHQEVDQLLRPWLDYLESEGDGIFSAQLYYTVEIAIVNLEAWGRPEQAAELRRRFGRE